jgi:2-hydroxychromene-2-carboxylate isomerase
MSAAERADEQPVFFYDLYSPYAYLAALRVDSVLPVSPRWQPIFFGVVLREIGRLPWSLTPGDREAGQEEVSRRAQERGLPEIMWPPGWPRESYSVRPLRAVVWLGLRDAEGAKALALKLYENVFVKGRALDDLSAMLDAAVACGLEREELEAGIEQVDVKDALRATTADALARGVTGIPTVAIGDTLFWGDDRLEDAAASLG